MTRDCAWTDRVTGERTTSRETVYGLTSLSRAQANATRWLELILLAGRNETFWASGGRESPEVFGGVEDSGDSHPPLAKCLALGRARDNRQPWTIENGVFSVRDETLGEDRSRIRTRSGPQMMAALRNAALSLLRLSGSMNITASLRSCSWKTQRTRNLLGIV